MKTVSPYGATELVEIGKVYARGDRPEIVLSDCSFTIEPGKLTVLLGPSGCGKSTLVKLLAGYERPSVGEIRLGGRSVSGPGPDRLVVFQETALFPWMTLMDAAGRGRSGRRQASGRGRTQGVRASLSGGTFRRHATTGGGRAGVDQSPESVAAR
jgi:NitT/TauT family transport system ATP-binding protein